MVVNMSSDVHLLFRLENSSGYGYDAGGREI